MCRATRWVDTGQIREFVSSAGIRRMCYLYPSRAALFGVRDVIIWE
jgi:hypothetical protein